MFGLGIHGYIYAALVTLLIVATGAAYLMFGKIEDLNKDIATLEANVAQVEQVNKSLNDTIDQMQDQREEDQRLITELSANINKVTIEKDEAISRLNGYRNRLSGLATKKPGLIGRRATTATRDVLFDFTCASGYRDKGHCSKEDGPSSSKPNTSAAGD